jgi:uncharacterized membrane protein
MSLHVDLPGRAGLALLALIAGVAACSGGSPAMPGLHLHSTSDPDASTSSSQDAPDDAGNPFAQCTTNPTSGTIPSNVAAVIKSKCQTCHTDPPKNGAPFALLTFADLHGMLGGLPLPAYQFAYVLIQPGADPHMPFGNAPQLTSTEFDTLSGWLLDCAPSQ